MKVLYLPGSIPLDYTLQLASALSEYCETSVLLFNTPRQREELSDLRVDSKVNLLLTEKVKFPLFHPYNIKVVFNMIKKIKVENYDIVHIQGSYLAGLLSLTNFLVVIIAKLINNSKIVATFHDVRPHPGTEKIYSSFGKFCLEKLSDAIFVHGDKLKSILMRKIEESKIYAIPMPEHNIAPMEKYIANSWKFEKENIVLLFGWIAYHKGIEYLIKASEIVKKTIPDLKVIIAGRIGKGKYDTSYYKKIKKMINNKDYFEVYAHFIPWDFAAELFMKSKIVVLPYIECSQSGVVPVAYRFKKPVIATNVGALPEIVENGKTGYIIPSRNVKVLAEKIIELLKNERLRLKMGERGYKKLKNDMSWENAAKIILKVYKKLLKDGK